MQPVVRTVSCFLTALILGLFIGYLAGLSTQPILSLVAASAVTSATVFIGLFKLQSDEGKPVHHLGLLAPHFVKPHPMMFVLCIATFCGACCWGINIGTQVRASKSTVDVAPELTDLNLALSPDEDFLAILLLKRMHELGFSEAERRRTMVQFDRHSLSDLYAHLHSDAHKDTDLLRMLSEAYESSLGNSLSTGDANQRLYHLQMQIYDFLNAVDHGRYHRLEQMLKSISEGDKGLASSLGFTREIQLTEQRYNQTRSRISPPRMPETGEGDSGEELKGDLPK